MRPQDVDKIAVAVVSSLAGVRDAGLLGCGAISNPVEYDWPACPSPSDFGCGSSYQCGGQGLFTCCEGFACMGGFICPSPNGFWCQNDLLFSCGPGSFACDWPFMYSRGCCHRFTSL